jgi:hypothetical protein
VVPVETMVESYYSVVKVGTVGSDFVGSILMALQNCVVDFVVLMDKQKLELNYFGVEEKLVKDPFVMVQILEYYYFMRVNRVVQNHFWMVQNVAQLHFGMVQKVAQLHFGMVQSVAQHHF